MSYDVA